MKALVAFSDTVKDEDVEYTEVSMNKAVSPEITDSNLPSIFEKVISDYL